MKKTMMKALIAVLIAALSMSALAACGRNPQPYDEHQTLPVMLYANTTTQAYYITIEYTQTTTEHTTTTEQTETTTVAPTPQTVAEIVAFYNAAANRVKTDRPGFSQTDRTIINENLVEVPWAFRAIAPGIIRMTQNLWGAWSEPEVVVPGANHNAFFAEGQTWSSRLQAGWVQSATLQQVGQEYHIRIALRDEQVPVLPHDGTTTRHGQVMKVFTHADIMEGVDNLLGIDILAWDALYSGSYLQARVCSQTHNLLHVRFFLNATVHAQIRTIGITSNVTLPIAQEYVFTMNVR
ncbi:MAG: hypothetical protein FWE40_06155 [Oscillospiraceae bacterium]|nr:hypothetical protein [Oscillospiraceae bacterium]